MAANMRIIGRQTFLSIFYGHGMSFFWLFQTIFSLYIYRGVERGNLVSERHSDKLKPGNRARTPFRIALFVDVTFEVDSSTLLLPLLHIHMRVCIRGVIRPQVWHTT